MSWQRSGPEGGRRFSRCSVLLQERRGRVGVPGGSLLFCRRWLGGKLLHRAEFGVSSPQPALRSQPLDSLREANTAAPSLGPCWASKCTPRTEGEQAGGPPSESVLSSRPVACHLPSSGDTVPLCTPPPPPRLMTIALYKEQLIFNYRRILPSGFPDSSVGKESTCNVGDPSLIPGSGKSPGEGIGYLLQYSWASLMAQTKEFT